MALAHGLEQAGHNPEQISTQAEVSIEPDQGGFTITNIDLSCQASVPGIDPQEFEKHAQNAKTGCPVSKALAGTKINLRAKLAE